MQWASSHKLGRPWWLLQCQQYKPDASHLAPKLAPAPPESLLTYLRNPKSPQHPSTPNVIAAANLMADCTARGRARQKRTAEAWEAYRDIIHDLYMTQDKTNEEVVSVLGEVFGLHVE